jgi:hypothetical protein
MPDDFEPDVVDDGADGAPADDPAPDDTAEPGGDVPAEDAPSDDGDETPGDEQTPATGGSEKLQKLLSKYGGDSDKMVDAYWEQAKSLSALDKKLDALIETVNSKNLPPEEEAKLIADDPDVKEIGAELASLDADVKNYANEDKQLVAQYGQLETLLKQLEAKLEFAPDDITKLELKREVAEAKREQRDVGREWRNNQVNLKNAQRQMQGFVRQYREAEIRAKVKRDQAKKQEWEVRAGSEGTRKEFASALRNEVESYGIAPDSKLFGVMQQSVRDRLVNYLRSLGDDAEGIDIPGAVTVLVKEYADVMSLKKKFATLSKQKAGVTGKQPTGTVTPGKGRVPTTDKAGNWTPQYVRERAKRLLG